jgi:GNAT superfamily N-acetyltransferase
MTHSIERITDPAVFAPETEDYYKQDLVSDLLPLYVSRRAKRGSEVSEGYWVKDAAGAIQLAAFRAVPFHFLLSHGNVDAATALGTHWAGTDAPGVTGPMDTTLACVKAWEAASGKVAKHDMDATFYILTAVEPYKMPEGKLRLAEKDDLEALIPIFKAGYADMKMPPEECDEGVIRATISYAIAERSQLVWDNGGVVATMRGVAEPPVARYVNIMTHPDHRGKGYGTGLVGGTSRGLISNGFAQIMLQADETNPVSNKLYQKLGFKPVTRTTAYSFE